MNKNINNAEGASLFAGEHSVFVPNNEHQDDEDDLEDQLRRQEELQNLIANAFDDLEYEDENSRVNSSFESGNSSKFKSNVSNVEQSVNNYTFTDQNYKNTSLNSFEQLQVLYQVRVKETQTLSKDLEELREQFNIERDQTSKKLLLLEADNNRLNISLKQSQGLLVEKNGEIDQKSKEINQLKEFIENVQTSNEKFEEDILIWKSNCNELEQKLHLMEKGINKNISEKQIRAHYEQEINKLQDILQSTNSKLEKLEREYQALQNKIQEIEYDKEKSLAEKAGVINTISKNLEDSQSHCFSLLNKINTLQQEKTVLEHEISSKQDMSTKHTTNQNYEDVIVTLREELRRSLEEQSKKRQEIKQLENLLKKSHEKEEKMKQELNSKQSAEKNENDKLKLSNKNLNEKITNLQHKLKELEEKNQRKQDDSTNSSRSSINSEKHRKKREEYEKLQQELNKVEKHIHESLNLRDRYIKCEQQCLNLQETIAELNSKLSESQFTITGLKEKLVLKEERDDLIEELKKKAAMFEEYMANKPNPIATANTSMNTSYYLPQKLDIAVQTEDDKIYEKRLNELTKTVQYQIAQLQILYEENKSLKEKLLFDRNSFTELTAIWTHETKKLNHSLQVSLNRNEALIRNINELKKENVQKQLMCDIQNSKIEQAKEYINLMEVTSTRHNKHVLFEHEQIKAKFEDLLGMIQARLSKCIDVTKTNVL